MYKPIKILLIEDNVSDARLLQEELSEVMDFLFDIVHVDTLAKGFASLETTKVDIVLLDLTLPDSSGIDTFIRLYAKTDLLVPIIILSGMKDENLAINSVHKGAQDYLVKGEISSSMLVKSIRHSIERNKARIELQMSQEELQIITQNITDLVAIVDSKGKYKYKSPSYKKLDAINSPEFVFFDEIYPADREMVVDVFSEMLKMTTGQKFEYRLMLGNGSLCFLETQATIVFNQNGDFDKIVLVSRDITERKRIEEELNRLYVEVNNLARKIFEHSKEGMAIVSSEGLVEFVNSVFEEQTGYKKDEIIGQSLTLLKSESQNGKPFQKIWDQVLKGKIYTGTLSNKRKTGETYFCESTIIPLKGKNGEITHFISLEKDVNSSSTEISA